MKNTIGCFLKVILTSAILWLPAYGQAAAARPLAGQPFTRASLSLAAPLAVTAMLSDPCYPKNPKITCLSLPSGSSPSSLLKITFSAEVVVSKLVLRVTSAKGTTIFEIKLTYKRSKKPSQSLLLSLNEKEQKEAAPFFIKDNKMEIIVTTKEPVESATIEVVAEEKK